MWKRSNSNPAARCIYPLDLCKHCTRDAYSRKADNTLLILLHSDVETINDDCVDPQLDV